MSTFHSKRVPFYQDIKKTIILFVGISVAISGLFILTLISGIISITKMPLPIKMKEQAEILSVFPDIPVYYKAHLIKSSTKKTSEITAYSAQWETQDPPEKVSQWYMKNLSDSAWSLDIVPTEPLSNDVQLIVAKKGEDILNLSIINQPATKKSVIVAEIPPRPEPEKEEEEGK